MQLPDLVAFVSKYFQEYIYQTLFFLIFIEEAGIPIPLPGDAWISFAGYYAQQGKINSLLVIVEVVIASVIGASLLYGLIFWKGEPLIEKYGKYIRIKKERLDKGKVWFSKYGFWVIIVGRWIPGLRIILTIVAGIFRVNYTKFILSIAISSFVWAIAYVYLGVLLGKKFNLAWEFIHKIIFSQYLTFYLIIFVILIIGIYAILKKRK